MRYHYERPKTFIDAGERYVCSHPAYNSCTLFRLDDEGLGIIQQRYRVDDKTTYWTEIDPWIANDLYLHPGFSEYLRTHAGVSKNGIYPTVTVRQIMWALKMKPLPKRRWETVFDRKDI